MADVDFDEFPQGVASGQASLAAGQPALAAPPAAQAATPHDVDFDEFPQGMADSSATGAFVRGISTGVAPAAGGLAGAGVGAEIGGAATLAGGPVGGAVAGGAAGAGIGYGLGEVLGYPKTGAAVGGTIGAVAGAFGGAPIVGGLAGAFGGGAALQKGQDWLISELPESWQEKFREHQEADTAQHGNFQYFGGLVPYALTMSPRVGAVAALPDNATNLQKLMANPITQRMFSGTVMGGTELGQEYASGQSPDWAKIGISTGMGFFLPRPNAIGEKILAAPFAAVGGRVAARPSATLAEAADAKVMGPGITEDVYQGQERQDPQAEQAAQQAARVEKIALEGPPKPDVADAARNANPELFAAYDAAQERLDSVQKIVAPDLEGAADVKNRLAEAQAHIDQLGPEVSRAYREAAESLGTEMVAPELPPSVPEAAATAGEAKPPETPPQPVQSREEMASKIADDVKSQLVRAGVSDDKADSRAQMEAAFFDTLAARGSGAFGTAEDLYNKHGPLWKQKLPAARPNVFELAQQAPFDWTPGGGGKTAEIGNTTIDYGVASDGKSAEVIRVYTPNEMRGQGSARAAMEHFLSQTDEQGKTVFLNSEPMGKGGASKRQLDDFYKSLGFVKNTGKNKDFSSRAEFVRQPKEFEQRPAPTKTPEFKNWFGDSKVVDNEGKPLVVYHGTSDDFGTFDLDSKGRKDTGWLGRGVYMTTDPNLAGSYANLKPGMADPNIMPLFAKVENPYHATIQDKQRLMLISNRDKYEGLNAAAEWTRELRAKGYDGVILEYKESEVGKANASKEIVAFDPTAVKSATGNSGAFDPNDPRILNQSAKGKVRFVAGKRPLVTLFKDADFSTLVHEGAHNYLEIMGQYAEHPDAPDALKDDWQTVKDWLKVDDRDGIKTRQHEQFARGFEQYVREGVAPSPRLASAFAQFKQWMVSIYRTISGLGKPISDDIRNVFDRLLAEEPHPTVIVPEAERGPTLPDIHEADAELVHPRHAEAIGDQIVADRDRAIAEHHPNVQAEIQNAVTTAEAAKPPGEGDSGAVGPSGVVEPSGEPGSEPGGGARGAAGGEEQRGGQQGVSEGAKLAGAESGGSGTESQRGSNAVNRAGNGMAPTNVDRLESRRPGDLTDKAGNIRLENLTNDDDARRAIRESAEENNDFIGDRRGIVTDSQVDDLAAALGMNQSWLLRRKIGQAFNAEQIVAARKLLIQSATQVSDLMKKAANGTDADLMAYAEAKARHQMIQGTVSGVTAEAGRALRAFRNIAGQEQAMEIDQFLKSATGKTLFQLKEEAKLGAQLGTPEQVSAWLDKEGKPKFGKMILEYWINGLISGIPTHVTYSVGNFIMAGSRILETPVASSIGALRAGLGREGNVIPFGEAAAKVRGAVKGLPTALEASAQAARTGLTTLLPGEEAKGTALAQYGGVIKEGATYGDAMRSWYGVGQGMKDGILAAGQLAAAGGDPNAPFFAATPTRGALPNVSIKGVPLPVGDVIRGPGRMIATIHSFFRAMNYSIEMNGLEFRRAWDEGHRGDALASRVADLRINRNADDMESARQEATEATLMGQGGQFTKKLSEFLNNEVNIPGLGPTPILKFIDPFVHISANIINQAIVQRTPIGILAPSIRADLMGRNGPIAADRAAARMLVGSALATAFGFLAAEGFVTGAGPQDYRKQAAWRLAGYQPHSVRINDTWYDLHRLGSLGMLLGMSADLYDVAATAAKDDFSVAAASFQHAIAQSVLDESFMRGPSELLKALSDKSYAPTYMRNFVSSFVPMSVGMSYEARAMDPYQRQTRSIIDAIKAKIPGESETLFPRIDLWGNPTPQGSALGGNAVSALWMSQVSKDPVNQEMVRLGFGKGQVSRKIRNQTLTDSEYDEYARLAGKMTKSNLDRIVNSSQWRSIPDSAKTKIVDEIFKQSREGASGIIMARHPDIPNGSYQQKLDRASGKNIRALQ